MSNNSPLVAWIVTAEHTAGRSLSHCCTSGRHEDPTESFEVTVLAITAEEAEELGQDALCNRIFEERKPCACGRDRGGDLGEDWFDSVALQAVAVAAVISGDD
tara:strand:+ start:412 stop:720 length:309 start_codon:yes stop_codon:yes gene_type:complete